MLVQFYFVNVSLLEGIYPILVEQCKKAWMFVGHMLGMKYYSVMSLFSMRKIIGNFYGEQVSLVENGQTNHGLHFVIRAKKITNLFCPQHCTPRPSMFFFFEQSLKSRVVWVFVAGCTYHPQL